MKNHNPNSKGHTKLIRNKLVIGLVLSLVLLIGASVFAYYLTNNPSYSYLIYASGCTPSCKNVTNAFGEDLYVNNESCGDWNSFLSNAPAGVTFADCCVATTEVCDNADNDCNAGTSDGSAEAWFGNACDGTDTDLCAEGTYACTTGSQVCLDSTGDNVEVCNGADDDCDGSTDEGVTTRYYLDVDGDGYGISTYQDLCAPSGDYDSSYSTDCNDGDVSINPGAAENPPNCADNNCNGIIDDAYNLSCSTYDGVTITHCGTICIYTTQLHDCNFGDLIGGKSAAEQCINGATLPGWNSGSTENSYLNAGGVCGNTDTFVCTP